MTIDDLRTLLEYHYWARDRLLEALEPLPAAELTRDLGSSFNSIRDTLAHVCGAEWAWYRRWKGDSPTAIPPAGRFADVAAVRREWQALERDVRAFVDELGPERIHDRFPYRLFSGTEAASVFTHMVQHVVNHASYHRGQITTMLRQIGAATPASMDLIAFYRTREQVQR